MVIFHSYVGLPEGMAGKEDGTMAAGFSSHGFPVFLGGKWTIDHVSDVEDSFKINQIL